MKSSDISVFLVTHCYESATIPYPFSSPFNLAWPLLHVHTKNPEANIFMLSKNLIYELTNRKNTLVVCASLAALLAQPLNAIAGAPTDQIQSAVEKVTTILKDPKLQGDAKKKELRETVYPKFDFNEMARRSLGSHWQRRSPEEQREFVRLFTELVESAYMTNLDGYQGEKVVIGGEKQDKEFAEVNTKIISKKGEEFAVNYKLHQAANDWKIYDVVIENISLVNNYRSQFNRVIAQSSFDDLFRKMKDKQFEAAGKKRST